MQKQRVRMAEAIPFTSVFPPECIQIIGSETTKVAVLDKLVSLLFREGYVSAERVPTLALALLERERVGTSAIGGGLAFPHLVTRAVTRFIGAIGLAPGGTDFQSLDAAATRLILLTLAPITQRRPFLDLMRRLTAMARDKALSSFLQDHRSPQQVYSYLADLDGRLREEPLPSF